MAYFYGSASKKRRSWESVCLAHQVPTSWCLPRSSPGSWFQVPVSCACLLQLFPALHPVLAPQSTDRLAPAVLKNYMFHLFLFTRTFSCLILFLFGSFSRVNLIFRKSFADSLLGLVSFFFSETCTILLPTCSLSEVQQEGARNLRRPCQISTL